MERSDAMTRRAALVGVGTTGLVLLGLNDAFAQFPPRVAANPQDKWVLVMGSRIVVITNDGRVFAHEITGNTVGTPFQLGT